MAHIKKFDEINEELAFNGLQSEDAKVVVIKKKVMRGSSLSVEDAYDNFGDFYNAVWEYDECRPNADGSAVLVFEDGSEIVFKIEIDTYGAFSYLKENFD